jgi:hypothetical protein
LGFARLFRQKRNLFPSGTGSGADIPAAALKGFNCGRAQPKAKKISRQNTQGGRIGSLIIRQEPMK